MGSLFIDDLAIGKLMKFLQITLLKEIFEINKNAFSYKNIITSYHIRCKLEIMDIQDF